MGNDTAVAVMGGVGDGNQIASLTVCFSEKMLDGLGKIQEELKLRGRRQGKAKQRGK